MENPFLMHINEQNLQHWLFHAAINIRGFEHLFRISSPLIDLQVPYPQSCSCCRRLGARIIEGACSNYTPFQVVPAPYLRSIMESERKEQLLEPLTDTEGYTVPFGVHVRAIDLQLPPLPAVSSQRHRAIAAGSSDVVPRWIPIKLDPLDSDYGSAWDFAAKLQEKSGVDKLDGQYSAEIVSHSKPGDEDEPIFAPSIILAPRRLQQEQL